MKKTTIIFAFIGIGMGVVCFIAGWKIKNVQCEYELYNYAWQVDSLTRLDWLREEEQLPYYGMKKEEVLALLPTTDYINSGIILYDGGITQWRLHYPYVERLRGTQDTIIVDTYYWKIPYHDRPDLFIVFEKQGEEWIVSACVQWDSERVYID